MAKNDGEWMAHSTMLAIIGRMAAYTGQKVKWEDAINSNLSLANVDEMASMTGDPPVMPDEDGNYPVPKP